MVFVSKVINKSESITSDLSNDRNPPANGSLDLAIQAAAGEPIKASGFIGQSSADPSLDITQVPQEVPTSRSTQVPELLHRLPEPVHRVAHVLNAVLHGLVLEASNGAAFRQVGHEGRGETGPGEADGEGGLDELAAALADGGGVGREGLDAQRRVAGDSAGGFDEGCGGGVCGCGIVKGYKDENRE